MDLSTTNGGIHLDAVAGNVRARTTNGGVRVVLEGEHWDGDGLDAETTNGGVRLDLPERYAAHLETGTVNGHIDIDFPVMVQGRLNHHIETDLGGGGKTIRVTTTNGGVAVHRRSRGLGGKGFRRQERRLLPSLVEAWVRARGFVGGCR